MTADQILQRVMRGVVAAEVFAVDFDMPAFTVLANHDRPDAAGKGVTGDVFHGGLRHV